MYGITHVWVTILAILRVGMPAAGALMETKLPNNEAFCINIMTLVRRKMGEKRAVAWR